MRLGLSIRALPLLALPFAGGAGLVIYVLAGVSLPLAAGAVGLLGACGWLMVLTHASPAAHREVRRRASAGLRAGALATAAYDASRYGLVALLTFSFQPFHVIPIFGRLFVGADASQGLAVAAGICYHAANGIGFAIAYALLIRRPSVVSGVAWGVGLELTMALLYPRWLRIAALQEFLTVSAAGHLVYGSMLGLTVSRRLRRSSEGTGP